MSQPRFFAEYRDTVATRAIAVVEAILLLGFCIFFMNAPETYQVRNIATVYFAILIVALVVIVVDSVFEGNRLVAHHGMGSGYRAVWGILAGIAFALTFKEALGLSFIGRGFFAAVSPSATLFWFLVVVGPRTEESFRNVLVPTLTKLMCIIFPRTNGDILGFVSINIMAVAFAVFHYFTYMQVSMGSSGASLLALMFVAYIYAMSFSLGNYLLKTDEFSKVAHMLYNYLVYSQNYPINLPLYQVGAILGVGTLISIFVVITLLPYVLKRRKR